MNTSLTIQQAINNIKQGEIITYPTEAVFGLGCDPFNQQAIEKLLMLKQRDASKGLILLINNWQQLSALIAPIPSLIQNKLTDYWPGPTTLLLPKSPLIPEWIHGSHDKVAIRMINHPVTKALCQHAPLVSTSANLQGKPSAMSSHDINQQFPFGLAGIVQGELGKAGKPSRIIDIMNNKVIRN